MFLSNLFFPTYSLAFISFSVIKINWLITKSKGESDNSQKSQNLGKNAIFSTIPFFLLNVIM